MLEDCKETVLGILKSCVRPEFLNRIDEIIMFDPLTRGDIRDILHIQMKALQAKLADEGVTLSFTQAFEDYMVEHGYSPTYGARPVKRILQRDLVNQLATAILNGSVHKSSAIEADSAGDSIVLRNK